MFEAFDPEQDYRLEKLTTLSPSAAPSRAKAEPDDTIRTVLEAGFRSRILSYRSAYAMGARSGFSLSELRRRTPICAAMIKAGLSCAVDEPLFAALVYHHADSAKAIAKTCRKK
ncbi:MAG: hypothetical protein N4A65_13500 [Cohaesibacter sp.]|jgi:hypothetical protein|nr:hypothetical protein [Cohaesibacter sp.]